MHICTVYCISTVVFSLGDGRNDNPYCILLYSMNDNSATKINSVAARKDKGRQKRTTKENACYVKAMVVWRKKLFVSDSNIH